MITNRFYKRIFLLFLALLLTVAGTITAQNEDTVYVALSDQPDGVFFLPAPPATDQMAYVDDLIRWQWGKTQRDTPRGTQASRESWWVPDMMRIVMAEALGLDTISNEQMPALSRLITRAYNTGNFSVMAPKKNYMRIRPFMEMGEDTWAQYDDDYLRTNGSYPSGHTAFGWATALVIAEMWPELQDTILRRGFQFGENRIITGAHYQSDVNAGYLCAAASIARAHNNPLLAEDIAAARAEVCRAKGLPADYNPVSRAGLPHGDKILNAPIDTADYRYLGDILRYKMAKQLQPTERGQQAIRDVPTSRRSFADMFGSLVGITISKDSTPAIWHLIDTVIVSGTRAARDLKRHYFRKRPYVQLNEKTPVPEEEVSHAITSSYASAHAHIGWAVALVLAEVAPDRQNEVLRRGFEYGDSRLILGYHWASDIEAGRLLACAVVARLHADPSFAAWTQQARAEYRGIKTVE
jgi:membrane-associated phospholipid phosphatase